MPEKKLSDLKVGDEVLYIGGSYMTRVERIAKIIKITPTGRFRIDYNPNVQFSKNGIEMTKIDDWGMIRASIIPLTEEKREELHKLSTIRRAIYTLSALTDAFKKTTKTNLNDHYKKAMTLLMAFGIDAEDD